MENDPIVRPERHVDVPGALAAPSTFLLTVSAAYEARKTWACATANYLGQRHEILVRARAHRCSAKGARRR
jgi:hypothetical protein